MSLRERKQASLKRNKTVDRHFMRCGLTFRIMSPVYFYKVDFIVGFFPNYPSLPNKTMLIGHCQEEKSKVS